MYATFLLWNRSGEIWFISASWQNANAHLDPICRAAIFISVTKTDSISTTSNMHPSRTKILSETCWFVFTDFHFLSTGQTDVIWKFCTESVSPLNFFNLQLLHFIPGPWTSLLRERSRDDREKFTDVNYTEAFILLSQWHYSGEQVSNYSWLTNSLPTCWKL